MTDDFGDDHTEETHDPESEQETESRRDVEDRGADRGMRNEPRDLTEE